MDDTRPLGARQDPYDAVPRWVQRLKIPFGAKLLYGALRTAHNTKWEPTYQQLAEHCNASVRSIIRWVKILANLTLIAVKRRGQGRPNRFAVLGRVTSKDDAASSPGQPTSHPRPETPSLLKEPVKRRFDTTVNQGTCFGCKGSHRTAECTQYASQIKT